MKNIFIEFVLLIFFIQTQLNRGTLTLPQDYVTRDILEVEMLKSHKLICKSCRDNKEATHKCITCCNFLCSSCESMHKVKFYDS